MTRRRLDVVTVRGVRPRPVVTLRWPVLRPPPSLRRGAEIVVIRGPQGSGKTTVARALAMAATARGESAIVLDGDDNHRGLLAIAKRVDLVVLCQQGTSPKLPRALRVAYSLTCQAGA